ncbi:hypothetical protein JXI42_11095 [bacterium]|nr:hypothetical protein [bacterium]
MLSTEQKNFLHRLNNLLENIYSQENFHISDILSKLGCNDKLMSDIKTKYLSQYLDRLRHGLTEFINSNFPSREANSLFTFLGIRGNFAVLNNGKPDDMEKALKRFHEPDFLVGFEAVFITSIKEL